VERHERFRGKCFCTECCRLMNRKRPETNAYMKHIPRERKPPQGILLKIIGPGTPRGSMTTYVDDFGRVEIYARVGHDNIFLGIANDRDEGVRLYNDYAVRYNCIQYNKRGDNW